MRRFSPSVIRARSTGRTPELRSPLAAGDELAERWYPHRSAHQPRTAAGGSDQLRTAGPPDLVHRDREPRTGRMDALADSRPGARWSPGDEGCGTRHEAALRRRLGPGAPRLVPRNARRGPGPADCRRVPAPATCDRPARRRRPAAAGLRRTPRDRATRIDPRQASATAARLLPRHQSGCAGPERDRLRPPLPTAPAPRSDAAGSTHRGLGAAALPRRRLGVAFRAHRRGGGRRSPAPGPDAVVPRPAPSERTGHRRHHAPALPQHGHPDRGGPS